MLLDTAHLIWVVPLQRLEKVVPPLWEDEGRGSPLLLPCICPNALSSNSSQLYIGRSLDFRGHSGVFEYVIRDCLVGHSVYLSVLGQSHHH